jgi:pimeloyl-ACP methyl ester carboxylesterase
LACSLLPARGMRSSRSAAAAAACFLACGCGSGAANPLASGESADAGVDTGIDAGGAAPGPDAAPTSTAAVSFYDLAPDTPVPAPSMLWTDPFDVRITGLEPGAQVTVGARFTGWGSSAVFQSDAEGTVDLATAVPVSGSYAGADADGIVWSMTASSSSSDPPNDPYGLRITVEVGGATVASGEQERIATVPGVSCSNVSAQGLVGYYCAPASGPRYGGIVTFGGSEGGLTTGAMYASYLASIGYPTLGLAYFSAPGVPTNLVNIPLEYFDTAMTWLAARPEVAPGKLAVLGGSRGGELALLLGATFPKVTAVVAALPSGVVWPGIPADNSIVPAWTYQGKAIGYLNVPVTTQPLQVTEPDGVVAYAFANGFLAEVTAATPAELDQATTRVENTSGPVLMEAGEDDQLWAACTLGQIAMDRLKSSGHAAKYADALDCYPEAGHNVISILLGEPTTSAMHTAQPVDGTYLALGGTAAGIAHASRQSDKKLRAFLEANLR